MIELLERQEAWRALELAFWEARAGSGRLALVTGEAGVGKTALIERFVSTQAAGARVWWGACDALFAPRPLGPLYDMAPQIQGAIPALLDAPDQRSTLYSNLLVELQNRPTLVVIEDVHWIDEATLDLLRYLSRRLVRTSALIVLTYRDDEWASTHPVRAAIETMAAVSECRRIALAPLSADAVRTLIGPRPMDSTALHALTGGNPFLVDEVMAGPEGAIPATVRDAVLARLLRLTPSGRAVLQAAAVLGSRIEPWALSTLTGAEAGYAAECIEAGLLVQRGKVLAFRHELSRQVVLDAIPLTQRLALHRMALQALRAHPSTRGDLARLAHPADGSGDDDLIVAYAPPAARQAATGRAHRAAVRLYELALAHAAGLLPSERAELLQEYSVECDVVNRRSDAIRAIEEARALFAESGLPLREGHCLSRLALLLQITGRRAEAERANAMALAVLEPLAPNRELISAYNMESWLSLGADDPVKGIASVDKALTLAEHFEAEGDLPRLFEVAGLLWITQDRQRGMAYLERALTVALKLDHATRAANIYTNLALLYVDDYRFDAAQTLFDIAIPFAQERDLDFARSQMSSSLALLNMHRGEWQAADHLTREALSRGPTSPARGSALLALGRLRARRGDTSAMEPLDEALDLLLRQGFRQLEGSVRVARAEAAWQAGDCGAAIDEARAGLELALSHRQAWYVGEMAFWLWRAGESPVLPTWTAQPFALHIRGDWRAAAEAWAALGCPYEQARALADGDVDAQREALEIFSRLQARPAATALRARLRAAGVGGLKHGPRSATRQHPLGITRRQAEVLDQLVDGLTNAEIAARLHLSPKTVEKHVSALLARLEVNTRQEAIDKVRRTSAA